MPEVACYIEVVTRSQVYVRLRCGEGVRRSNRVGFYTYFTPEVTRRILGPPGSGLASPTGCRQSVHVLVAMAIGTLRRGVLVDHDLLVRDHLRLLMALIAGHIGMAAGEREVGLGVVVESRRLPFGGRVAIRTVGSVVFG